MESEQNPTIVILTDPIPMSAPAAASTTTSFRTVSLAGL